MSVPPTGRPPKGSSVRSGPSACRIHTMISSAGFTGWEPVARAVLVGVLSYIAIVVIIRLTGKRTLASLNAFDFIVTVALGSILATMLLSRDVSLAEGVAGFLVLVGLQFVVSWAA